MEKKVKAYHPVVTDKGWSVGIAVWGESGYHPTEFFFLTEKGAQDFCDSQNKNIGIKRKQAYIIVANTMFPGCKYTLEDVVRAGKE